MTEKNFQSPEEESKIELIIHNNWLPEWHILKIKNYVYNLENFENFCKDVLQIKPSEDVKELIRALLVTEIIASVMFLAEALAAIAKACSTNPKNIQRYLKEFNATDFYKKNNLMDNEYYAKILSLPQLDLIIEDRREEIADSLKDFKEALNEIREYYFSQLDLFNSYKHGFRIFPLLRFDEDNKLVSTIIYFSQRHKQNVVTVKRMDRNLHKHQKIARDISYLIRIILRNHENKLKNPDSWETTIPAKRKKEK